jgi:precorrin-4/cobalt-precorrin-4 C11-methyltransferase
VTAGARIPPTALGPGDGAVGRTPGVEGAAGRISFVGAGPGAADLVTLRGAARLGGADIVIWASSLVPAELLQHARPGADVRDSAAMTLEDVLAVYETNPGAAIVRLHSGDPSLYGALQEQVDWCLARGRPYEIVPGVSSLGAAAAAVGRELTVPQVAQSVVVTRLASRTARSVPPAETIGAFAATGCTMAVFLSAARPERLAQELLAPPSRYTADTPAAIVVRATWPDEQVVVTTVGRLAADVRSTGASTTVLVLVGPALEGAAPRSHLYSPEFAHAHRRRSLPGTTAGRPARRRARRE